MDQSDKDILQRLDLLSMAKDILRQWWVILLFSISAALLTNVIMEETYTPEYSSSTTFAVSSNTFNSDAYSNLSSAINLTSQFEQVLQFNLLKTTVCKDLGISTFDAETKVEVMDNTNMIKLTVTAASPLESYRIMKSILKNYHVVTDYVLSGIILDTVSAPAIPTEPSNYLDIRTRMKQAFLITALAFIIIFGVFSYMKDTIKNENDAKWKIDARLLGTVYREKKKRMVKKKNRAMIILNPLVSHRFVESYRMITAKMINRMDRRGAQTVLITSVTENEGKSTVAANIALCLAQEGKRVILIDCDFRKPALYKIFTSDENQTIDLPAVLKSKTIPKDFIRLVPGTGLCTIFNSQQSFDVEDMLYTGTFDVIMKFCRQHMDYVILDTSPMGLVSDTEQIARFADASVIVVSQDRILSRDINDTIDVLNGTEAKVVGCVFNNVVKGFTSPGESVR